MSRNETLPKITLSDGWNAIIHDGKLFVLDLKKEDERLSPNRTIFSLITDDDSFKTKSIQVIYNLMTKVTKEHNLSSWTEKEDKLKSLSNARGCVTKPSSRYMAIRDWYKDQKNESTGGAFTKDQKISNAMLPNEVQKLKEELLSLEERVMKLEAIINK